MYSTLTRSGRCSAVRFNLTVLRRSIYNSQSDVMDYDVAIIGGGIVGCATARELINRYPNFTIALLEKESDLAKHQSGRNSGVIHSGIYYTPGSLKAKLCVKGAELTYKYCDHYNIPYKRCGKLIVAVDDSEIERLNELFSRASQNKVSGIEIWNAKMISDYEPNVVGVKAIWSPTTGIIDYGAVTHSYGKQFTEMGGKTYLHSTVTAIEPFKDGVRIERRDKSRITAKYVISCAGLFADRIARMTGCSTEPKIVPFRGEYLLLKPEFNNLVKTNIYPVPDPRFPFLGIHFTPRINGDIWLGPNAVLAFKREGYSYSSISGTDLVDALKFRGTRRLMWKYFGFGMQEYYRGIFKKAQVRKLQRFVPSLKSSMVMTGPTGVRAQALDSKGNLVDDFVIDSGPNECELFNRVLHVRNAPSPAATSSLAIAEMIVDKCKTKFKWSNTELVEQWKSY